MNRRSLLDALARLTGGSTEIAAETVAGARRPRAYRKRTMLMMAAPLLAIGGQATAGVALRPSAAPRRGPTTAAQRPNILIIVADDLGFADVGFNGAQVPTPNIDRIAHMGMRLDHFYASALCSPSRAGLLTGRYPNRFGIMGDTITPGSDFGLDPNENTIANVLGSAGYVRRSFLGKWHLGHRSLVYHPMHFGFTSFYGHYNGAIDYFTHEREGQPDWHRDYKAVPDAGYSTDLLTTEAVRIIQTPSPKGAPWMMWLAYNAPHGPLQAKPEDLAAMGFDPSKPLIKANRTQREGATYGDQGRGNTRRQTELAMVHAMDRGIGQVLDALDRTGQLENTIILFTSDNGGPGNTSAKDNPSSNGPLRGWKFLHYEGGVRVAAAIAWPGHLKPRAQADMGAMAYVDVLPTMAHFAHASLQHVVDGRDVSQSILTGRPIPDRTIFLGEDYRIPAAQGERGPTSPEALRGRMASAIVGRWKLVGDQLFDILADPYEQHDVAAEHPDQVRIVGKQIAKYVALRQVPRERMNATHLPPIPLWELPEASDSAKGQP